jgi:hypothetical protein
VKREFCSFAVVTSHHLLQETILKNIWMKNKIIYLCIPILSAYIKKAQQ